MQLLPLQDDLTNERVSKWVQQISSEMGAERQSRETACRALLPAFCMAVYTC